MNRRVVPLLVLALAPVAVGGCGDDRGVDPPPHAEATGDAPVEIVNEDAADLLLHVSNQSFDDEEVRLTVTVDGVTVVDGDFHVENQHNWISYPLALPPGRHEITVESDSGASLRESFEVPAEGRRYAVVDHWGAEGSAELTWLVRRRPIAFA